ncbi:MAG: hypothetical protein KA474_08195 [Acinetobacter sp.]|nr:hypothetical protein [Acinetobacter sp.]
MKFIAFFCVFFGCVLMYCTHVNQDLLDKKLPDSLRWFALLSIGLALILFLISTPKLVAIFMWLLTILVMWSFLPFIPLIFKKYSS